MRRHGIDDYDTLLKRSITDLAWFWNAVSEDLGLRWIQPYRRVYDSSDGIAWTRWWIDGAYNYVENALDRHVARLGNKTAIRYESEDGKTRTLTYREVLAEVNRLANALRRLGIRRGDRVGIFMPLGPECAIATLAVSRMGAIYIPIFSGFGAAAVASRLADCEAVALITADGFTRRGTTMPMKETADEAVRTVPSIEHVLVHRHVDRKVPWAQGRDHWWGDLTRDESAEAGREPTSADDPFMIIYTSGTTGRPKGTVHVHGGFPIKGTMDMAYGFDFQEYDTMFWLTDLGWMMGPWEIIGVLTLGGTMLLYDGAIDYPQTDRLWALLERHRVTVAGISPTAIRAMMRHGESALRQRDLGSLRLLGSTGEPWNPQAWLWYFRNVGGGRCPILNYSGGTEISGGIVGCTVLHPQKPCSFTGPVLGMDAEVVDDAGRPVRGAVGELVVRRPWPGMTRGFWKDPDRYLQTYWSRWPDVWVHGDWVRIDGDGFWYIQGRSDDTIKVAGKRVGPAEIESVLTSHPAVSEAAAIGVPDELKGESVVCFAVLRPGVEPSEELRAALIQQVVDQQGKALRPKRVLFVHDLPKTRNAKIMRRVIRARYLGSDPGDISSLENPQAVEEIAKAQ
jgi:acetyl-CoA synthetase